MIVADASAVVEFVVHRDAAPRLRQRLRREAIHAPYLIEVETLNGLRRVARRDALPDAIVSLAREAIASMPLMLYPHRPLMERIWELRHTHSAYDASYIALAELLHAPLITCDARLARSSGHDALIELFAPA